MPTGVSFDALSRVHGDESGAPLRFSAHALRLRDDQVHHRPKSVAFACPVEHGLAVGVLLALRVASLLADADYLTKPLFAAKGFGIRCELRHELGRDLRNCSSLAAPEFRQECECAVALGEPSALLDEFSRCSRAPPSFLDLVRDVPDETCIERGNRDGVLDTRADVADSKLDGRVGGRGMLPPA